MKKQQLDHVLCAAGRITGEKQFVIVGSQSLHGTYPDLADDIVMSAEVDLIAKRTDRTRLLALVDTTPVAAAVQARIRDDIAKDFSRGRRS